MTPSRRMPTQVGDVLLLRTKTTSFDVHAVGLVSKDGQQDFHGQMNVTYVHDAAAAMVEATALVQPGRRLFIWNLDTGDWSEAHPAITRQSDVPSRDRAVIPGQRENAEGRQMSRPRPAKADLRPAPRVVRAS